MVKEKACTKCKTIFTGEKCSNCGEGAGVDTFKGEAVVFNADKSLIAHHAGIKSNGRFALKTK